MFKGLLPIAILAKTNKLRDCCLSLRLSYTQKLKLIQLLTKLILKDFVQFLEKKFLGIYKFLTLTSFNGYVDDINTDSSD